MLLLNSPRSIVVDGLTVFPDHADENQFWVLPGPVQLGKRRADGRASFTFIKFKPAAVQAGVKGGGFLSILEAVIGLGIQLGSIGAFGKKIKANINASTPGYANGGYPSRGLALVGERGPELVNFRGGERVFQQYHELPNFPGLAGPNHPVLGSWIVNQESFGVGIRESDGPITDYYCRFAPNLIEP